MRNPSPGDIVTIAPDTARLVGDTQARVVAVSGGGLLGGSQRIEIITPAGVRARVSGRALKLANPSLQLLRDVLAPGARMAAPGRRRFVMQVRTGEIAALRDRLEGASLGLGFSEGKVHVLRADTGATIGSGRSIRAAVDDAVRRGREGTMNNPRSLLADDRTVIREVVRKISGMAVFRQRDDGMILVLDRETGAEMGRGRDLDQAALDAALKSGFHVPGINPLSRVQMRANPIRAGEERILYLPQDALFGNRIVVSPTGRWRVPRHVAPQHAGRAREYEVRIKTGPSTGQLTWAKSFHLIKPERIRGRPLGQLVVRPRAANPANPERFLFTIRTRRPQAAAFARRLVEAHGGQAQLLHFEHDDPQGHRFLVGVTKMPEPEAVAALQRRFNPQRRRNPLNEPLLAARALYDRFVSEEMGRLKALPGAARDKFRLASLRAKQRFDALKAAR